MKAKSSFKTSEKIFSFSLKEIFCQIQNLLFFEDSAGTVEIWGKAVPFYCAKTLLGEVSENQ